MTLSAATALVPRVEIRLREPLAETTALLGVAAWCSQFTPSISLELPATVLLEVSGSLRLFKGLPAILRAHRTGLAAMGYTASIACTATPKAASWLAQAGREIAVTDSARLSAALAKLPITFVADDGDTVAALSNIGISTLGELLLLPRAGVARRFGARLLDEIDRALGRTPDPHRWYVPPASFKAGIELQAEVSETERLQFAVKRLILQLSGYLAGRAAAVQCFTMRLQHREQRSTDVAVGLVAPSRDADHFMLLLRERLERIALTEPVIALSLQAEDIKPLVQDNLSLFQDDTQSAGDWQRLIERLRSRLGNEAVQGLALRPEHRPEDASTTAELRVSIMRSAQTTMASRAELGTRPFWLLEQPKLLPGIHALPQYGGALKLLAGPERIESGWWDGRDVKRDYFVARTKTDALVWIYRERLAEKSSSSAQPWSQGRWYLHGLFA